MEPSLRQKLEDLRRKYAPALAAAEEARIAAKKAAPEEKAKAAAKAQAEKKTAADKKAKAEADKKAKADAKAEADEKALLQQKISNGFENRPENFSDNKFLEIPDVSDGVSKQLINFPPIKWADTVQKIVFGVLPKKHRPSVYGDQWLRAKAIIHRMQQNDLTDLYLMDGIGRFLSIVIKMAVSRRLNLNIYVVEIDPKRSSFHKRFFPQRKANGVQVTCLSEKDICVVAKELSSNSVNRLRSFVYANFCSLPSGKEMDEVFKLLQDGDLDMISFDTRNYQHRDGRLTQKGKIMKWLNKNAMTKYDNMLMQRKTFTSYLLIKPCIDGSSKRRNDHLGNKPKAHSKRPRDEDPPSEAEERVTKRPRDDPAVNQGG